MAKDEFAFSKPYPHYGLTVSIRPFNVCTDLPLFYEMAGIDDSFHLGHELLNTFQFIALTNTVKSCLIFVGGSPVCLVEIEYAWQSEIADYCQAIHGDYFIRLLPGSEKLNGKLFLCILRACLIYFFRDSKCKKILINADDENDRENYLVRKAGFKLQQQFFTQNGMINLYGCTRENMRRRLSKLN